MMVNNRISQKYKVGWIGGGTFFITIIIVVVSLFWHNKEPISPLATELGQEPEFDTILQYAEARWEFLFFTDTQIIRTNIYGDYAHTILNITQEMHDTQARLLWYAKGVSISPDGRYILTPLDYDAECSPDQYKFSDQLLRVDLTTRSSRLFTVRYNDFRLGWDYPIYWLNSTIFLVRIMKLNGVRRKVVRILRYEIGQLNTPEFIDLLSEDPVIRWKSTPPTFLFASEHEPVQHVTTVHAIDARGVRAATTQEMTYFQNTLPDETQSAASVPKVYMRKVIPGAEPLWETDYWRKHGDQYYIYLNDKIVRCSNGPPGLPSWDPELQLFIWGEGSSSYLMDRNGHYRSWYNKGHYAGKIPRL